MSSFPVEIDLLKRYALLAMERGHLDEVLAIERMSYTNPWPKEAFEHEIEDNPLSRPRVAVTYGAPREVAGYCVTWIVFEHLHIQNLAVHPRHRRLGLGRYLLWRALQEGEDRSVRYAQLEVRRSNEIAQRLYGSFGFRVVGERKDYYSQPREDAVLFQKELNRRPAPT